MQISLEMITGMTVEPVSPWSSFELNSVFATVATFLVALLATFGAFRTQRRSRPESEAPAEAALEKRLEDLAETMSRSARLIEQVSAEIDARAANAKKLKKEAETAEALVRLNEQERKAVARVVRSEISAEISAESKRTTRLTFLSGFLFFLAGAAASFFITLLF